MTDNILASSEDNVTEPADYLAELVGPGKKYADQQALAKAQYHADRYIPQLTTRLDELREDYKKVREENVTRAKLEEVLDKLTQRQQLPSSELPPANEDTNKPTINLTDVENLVNTKLQDNEAKRKAKENSDFVVGKLKERFGTNFGSAVKQQIQDLDMSDDEFNELARTKPKLLLKTLGLDQPVPKEPFQAPPSSQQRSFAPSVQKRTWSFYQKLRKDNPVAYHDPKTQMQLMQDKAQLGKDFEDGDWDLIN